MAHFVGKILHIRPNEILDNWCVSELIVAYGHYANEISMQNYEQWEAMHRPKKKVDERPEKYAVKFYGVDDLEDE